MSLGPVLLERLAERLYLRTGKRYPKFKMTTAWVASQATNQAVRDWKPDVVFSIVPFPYIFYREKAPCIYRLDTTFYGVEEFWPTFGRLGLWLSMWQEKRAYHQSARVITTSAWSKNILATKYNVPESQIRVYPMPSALPMEIVPQKVDIPNWKALQGTFRLLFVGRDYRRKGLDIAIDVTRRLDPGWHPGRIDRLRRAGTVGQVDKVCGILHEERSQRIGTICRISTGGHTC